MTFSDYIYDIFTPTAIGVLFTLALIISSLGHHGPRRFGLNKKLAVWLICLGGVFLGSVFTLLWLPLGLGSILPLLFWSTVTGVTAFRKFKNNAWEGKPSVKLEDGGLWMMFYLCVGNGLLLRNLLGLPAGSASSAELVLNAMLVALPMLVVFMPTTFALLTLGVAYWVLEVHAFSAVVKLSDVVGITVLNWLMSHLGQVRVKPALFVVAVPMSTLLMFVIPRGVFYVALRLSDFGRWLTSTLFILYAHV
ncbi:MAG: hypothetical protein AAF267_14660 [Deinococcota bacterium]